MAEESTPLSTVRAERNRFVAFAFASADVVLETDELGVVSFAAGAAEGLFGKSAAALVGTRVLALISANDRNGVGKALSGLVPGQRLDAIQVHSVCRDAEPRPISIHGYRLPDMPGRLFVTISRGWNTVAPENPMVGKRDPNTGLLDKAGFVEVAQRRVEEASIAGEDVSLTLMDMKELGGICLGLDDAAETSLMQSISSLMCDHSVDGGLAGQIDDGKFGVVHASSHKLEKLPQSIESLVRKAAPDAEEFSVGAYTMSLDSEDLSEQEAAQAILFTLNKFSEAEPENFSLSSLTESCRVMHSETVDWAQRIKRTVRDNAFSLAYQPIVSLTDGAIHHYEALTRLPGSDGGSPFKFVTMAEELGHIAEFDLAVLRRVLALQRATGVDSAAPIAVNLSGRSLTTPGFPEALIGAVQDAGVLRKHLLFEVTESSRITDLQAANRTLAVLRKQDVPICLDDFGVGAAAFEYLRTLDVDFVKIDGSFVRNMARSGFGRAFVRSISALCRELGIKTIGEMVEDEKTATLLRAAGVDMAQGFHFGRPSKQMQWLGNGIQENDPKQDLAKAEAERRMLRKGREQWDPISGGRIET